MTAKLSRQFDEIAPEGSAPVSVISAATGVADATGEERDLIAGWMDAGRVDAVWAQASMLGAATSATFPAALGLAALALSRRGFYRPFDATGLERRPPGPPERIATISAGIWRGEGMALAEAVD